MNDHYYVFAGGGTGGHLFPGLAVADALRECQPDAEVTFFTTTRPLDAELLASTPFGRIAQAVRPWTTNPLRMPGFWLNWRKSVAAARVLMKKRPPHAVLGLGGYAAGPAIVAAHSLGIRTAILNPDAIPGRANRYLAKRAKLVVLQWQAARSHFKPGTACETWGCPIRPGFVLASRAEGRSHFGLDVQRPLVLVTGASQGARTVNCAMQLVWPEFLARHPDWQLLHLTGKSDEYETRAAYADAGVGATVQAFAHEMWLAVAAADVVICRAGASTLAELTAARRPAILLPYPYHRDRHQHANARVLADAGAAIVLEDRRKPELNRAPLLDALVSLANRQRREQAARAAAALARPNAAMDVAAWLMC